MKKAIIAIVIIGCIVYAFNLTNGLFWDDTEWIVNNPYVHSFSFENIRHWFSDNVLSGIGLNSNYYRPFLMATFTLNYALHGESPVGYHLFNNGLHIANAILVFWLITALFLPNLI